MSDDELSENFYVCSLCGEESIGYGHNPEPLARFEQRCCEDCNWTKVIPARIGRAIERPDGT